MEFYISYLSCKTFINIYQINLNIGVLKNEKNEHFIKFNNSNNHAFEFQYICDIDKLK